MTATPLETNVEELRGMRTPRKTPACESRESIIFGIYDRLLDHGHGVINVAMAPALPDGSPNFGRADPANIEALPADDWPDNPQDEKRVIIVVDQIDGCAPETSMMLFFSDFGQPFMEQIAGPEDDADIAMRIIGRDIGARPPDKPTRPLQEQIAQLSADLAARKQPPVAANDNKPGALRLLNPAEWDGQPVPTREWYAEDLVPFRQVTIINGDGGLGKTLLALQIAAAGAMAIDTLGISPAAGRTLYVGAEDEADEFWRRLADITSAHGKSLRDLSDFRLLPLADTDALLMVPDKAGNMRPTALMQKLIEAAVDFLPRLIVLDTAADLFGGDEIKRGQVRQFIGGLRQMAIGLDCAVVLLAHPSVAGMTSGTGSSGSTAWNNSVRSRLYLTRPESKDGDPDLRILKTMKANYGTTGGEIKLRWKDGVFVLDDGRPPPGASLLAARAERVFLETLEKLYAQGQKLSPSPSATYAVKAIAGHPAAAGISKKELAAAQQRLLDANLIRIVEEGSPSRRTKYLMVVRNELSD
jgi:hypothetical protein